MRFGVETSTVSHVCHATKSKGIVQGYPRVLRIHIGPACWGCQIRLDRLDLSAKSPYIYGGCFHADSHAAKWYADPYIYGKVKIINDKWPVYLRILHEHPINGILWTRTSTGIHSYDITFGVTCKDECMTYMLRAMSPQTSHEKRVAGRRKEGESKRTSNHGGNHSHMTAQRFFPRLIRYEAPRHQWPSAKIKPGKAHAHHIVLLKPSCTLAATHVRWQQQASPMPVMRISGPFPSSQHPHRSHQQSHQ